MNDRVDRLEAELLALRTALAENRRRTRRLSLTNVVLAVVVLAFGGAGAAYALAPANSVNSASIIDRSIGTPDVKVGAFAGQTILDNSLTGADINESTLPFARGHRGIAGINTSANGSTVTLTGIQVPQTGYLQFWITVRCVSFSGSTDTSWDLTPQLDGTTLAGAGSGFISLPHAALASTPVDSTTLVAQAPVSAGTHTVGFSRTRTSGDGSLDCDLGTITTFVPFKNDGTSTASVPSSKPSSAKGTGAD